MFELVTIVLQKRKFVIVSLIGIIDLLLIALVAPTVQAHRASINAHIRTSHVIQARQGAYSDPDAMASELSQMSDNIGQTSNNIEIEMLRGAMSMASGVTVAEDAIAHGAVATASFTLHGASDCIGFISHTIGDSFACTGRMVGNTVGFISEVSNVSSVIRPMSHTPIPVITKLQKQQAVIIQSGTKGVVVTSINDGTGGACDDDNGNGYYPASWCNAAMDSIATIPYSGDPINRECTSYAYWYFTTIEGHTNFRAWGNAKYWAATSNYPAHAAPAVGAIAVETVGAYGHVAIVQALPGQKYAGQAVPAGYVLVSEMNYDWQGHFRYSYSPLSKFSNYIYP
jgi:hypothetical protein